MRVVALLRGVNTGGVRFAMRDLVAALTDAGHPTARTVLATGNVLLDAESPTAAATAVHDVVADRFGFDLAVVAVPLEAVRDAVTAYPFGRVGDRHAYVVFATDPAALRPLADDPRGDEEQVAAGDGVLFWDVPKGRTLESPFGKRLGRRTSSGAVTTRNLNTLEKIVAAG
ncbi:DUF1697 domain-containing protein [Amnibacterium endophyticum]|uniref:DUF1697 domain-containing protein n=1 Tax=Amnibacterium endophyticum TaxID=2109337 RepID=A0ABW4LG60_9MICO